MTRKILTPLLLLASITCFILGLIYPILGSKHQVFGIVLEYKEVRLFDSVCLFFEAGDYFLAAVIFVFTILFPIIKYIDLINRILPITSLSPKLSSMLKLLDKWSMLDVFLVALLLLNFKMDSSIIVMKLKAGTSFIAAAVIFRMLASVKNQS